MKPQNIKNKLEIRLNISVKDLSTCDGILGGVVCGMDNKGNLVRWLDKSYSSLEFTLKYPIRVHKIVKIKNPKCVADILFPIAKAYREIYWQADKYKVWGHSFEQLYFEKITIDNGKAQIAIGS